MLVYPIISLGRLEFSASVLSHVKDDPALPAGDTERLQSPTDISISPSGRALPHWLWTTSGCPSFLTSFILELPTVDRHLSSLLCKGVKLLFSLLLPSRFTLLSHS